MMEVISSLWLMSLQACILILTVLVVRSCLKKYPKIYTYALWALVGIRLLCPVFIETQFSLQPDYAMFSEEMQEQTVSGNKQGTSQGLLQNALADGITGPMWSDEGYNALEGITSGHNGSQFSGESKVENDEVITPVVSTTEETFSVDNILKIIAVIYVAGALIVAGIYCIQYLIIRHRISTAVRDKGNVWLCENIASPFVIGVVNSKIILPYNLNGQEKEHVLRHERTHIIHHDPIIRLVGIICLCLHWWNPLVWLAVHKINQDMEMFCDEAALKGSSLEERKSYARTLLEFSAKQSGFSVGLAFGESNTERRVKNLMTKRKGSIIIISLVVVLALFCMAAFMTMPRDEEDNKGTATVNNETVNNETEETTSSTPNDDVTQGTDEEDNTKSDIDKQIDIIAANVDMWKIITDYANEICSYAVTDLDGNGRLEVIASNMAGTGFYTYSYFYEVNEQFDGLVKCETDFVEGSSQPDIIDIIGDPVVMYHDAATNTFYYIEDDLLKVGLEYYRYKSALSLKDGRVTVTSLASEVHNYVSETGTITYWSTTGEEITEEYYNSIADAIFAGCEKYKIVFGWQDMKGLEGADTEAVLALLKQSYESFGIKESVPVKKLEAKLSDEARAAYIKVLEELYHNHRFPNGENLGIQPDDADVSLNRFALYDIDSDGSKELIIGYTTTYTAGQTVKIYDFDSEAGTVREELSEYPGLTFYDNGVISVMASHNHGRAAMRGDFWPYTLYRYDNESDTYVEVAIVDAWEKEQYVYNETFPDATDADGDGVVYYVMTDGEVIYNTPVDGEAYEQWLGSYIGGAGRITVPYMNLTEENIYGIE